MDDGRLGAAKRGSKHIRKITHVINQIIQNKQYQEQHYLSREQREINSKLVSQVVKLRKDAVRRRVLLQCLQMRKETSATSSEGSLRGAYDGKPLTEFARDVDQRIAWYHPALRRHRYIDRVKQGCLEEGSILKEDVAKEKIDSFFAKLREDEERRALAKQRLKVLPKKRQRRLGGLLVNDEDDPREGDFPDPFGTVKKAYDENPFERLANLRPTYYKMNLLRAEGHETSFISTAGKSNLNKSDGFNKEKSSISKYQLSLPDIEMKKQPTGNLTRVGTGPYFSRTSVTRLQVDKESSAGRAGMEDVKDFNVTHVDSKRNRSGQRNSLSLVLPPISADDSLMQSKH